MFQPARGRSQRSRQSWRPTKIAGHLYSSNRKAFSGTWFACASIALPGFAKKFCRTFCIIARAASASWRGEIEAMFCAAKITWLSDVSAGGLAAAGDSESALAAVLFTFDGGVWRRPGEILLWVSMIMASRFSIGCRGPRGIFSRVCQRVWAGGAAERPAG